MRFFLWLEQLLARPSDDANYNLALMLCGRRVADRYRDVGPELREDIVHHLQRRGAAAHIVSLVRDGGRLANEEASQVLGESLPLGLRLSQADA